MKHIKENIWIEIVEDEIPQAKLDQWLVHSNSGAICTFSGTTREWTGKERTAKLFYECYDEMALSEMLKIVEQSLSKWTLNKVTLLHRVGFVKIGESSVYVGVSSPHRADAFEACRFLIDTLKESVPIWKKDYDGDGNTEWVAEKKPDQ